jgi:hypothetical protein
MPDIINPKIYFSLFTLSAKNHHVTGIGFSEALPGAG